MHAYHESLQMIILMINGSRVLYGTKIGGCTLPPSQSIPQQTSFGGLSSNRITPLTNHIVVDLEM